MFTSKMNLRSLFIANIYEYIIWYVWCVNAVLSEYVNFYGTLQTS